MHILQRYTDSYGIFVDISDELIVERLKHRGDNDDDFINTRLSLASKQREHMDSFDYVIINKEINEFKETPLYEKIRNSFPDAKLLNIKKNKNKSKDE